MGTRPGHEGHDHGGAAVPEVAATSTEDMNTGTTEPTTTYSTGY